MQEKISLDMWLAGFKCSLTMDHVQWNPSTDGGVLIRSIFGSFFSTKVISINTVLPR